MLVGGACRRSCPIAGPQCFLVGNLVERRVASTASPPFVYLKRAEALANRAEKFESNMPITASDDPTPVDTPKMMPL